MTAPAHDTAAFLDPRVETRDGHHGWAIEAALKNVMGDSYANPVDQHRYATKRLHVGPGELITPPGGWRLHSIRELDIDFDHTRVIGRGAIPAVLTIDGCAYGRITGTPVVVGERVRGGGRTEVPRDVVVMQKSIAGNKGPNQTHFRFNGRIEGLWRDVGFRCGSPGWTTAQEDHHKSDEVIVHGAFDVHNDDAADLCRWGVWTGNDAWSNNRRSYLGLVHVAWCETAFRAQMTGATVERLVADGCRDYIQFSGAVTKVVVNGGEAEYCQRFINDVGGSQIGEQSLMVRDVYAKLDLWRPGLPGVEPRFADNACSIWSTRGGCFLDNVTIGSLPVTRGKDGKLRYAPSAGGGAKQATAIPAPRFWTTQPYANIYTRHSAAHGYRAAAGHNEFFALSPHGNGTCRHELWKNTDERGVVTGVEMAPITQ